MDECNPTYTPMESNLKFKEVEVVYEDSIEFRKLLGSLRYLTHTHVNLMFCVCFLSHFMEKPTMEHVKAAKGTLMYVKGIVNFGLIYMKGQNDAKLAGYYDSDLAGHKHGRNHTSGQIFFYGDMLITWSSKKNLLFHHVRLSISPRLLLHVRVFGCNI